MCRRPRPDSGCSAILINLISLFNDAFSISISDYIASNERMRMIVNNELERIWKEVIVA
jgi:hypothetical protein